MRVPEITRDDVLRAIQELLPDLADIKAGRHESTVYDLLWNRHQLPPKVVLARAVALATGKPFSEAKFSGGEAAGQANTILRRLGFSVVLKAGAAVALPLDLYGRYSRKEVYATQGVAFSPQNQNLIQGLSPQLDDGGYFVFVTLSKEDLPPEHAYADELFAHEFIWVTRRDRGEDHPDYLRLRQADTRISLFVRGHAGEEFAYLGELTYKAHRQFTDVTTGKVQQRYTWIVKNPVPDPILEELTFGTHPKKKPATGQQSQKKKSRMPSSFDEMKRAYSYAIDSSERTVIPEHQNYQVRLNQFLKAKGITADLERDFVDVAFSVDDQAFIGEIKVTTNLTIAQAFRTALGQVLDYAHVLFPQPPSMIIFLDAVPDERRVQLATKLGVAVIVEQSDGFKLMNPTLAQALRPLFEAPEPVKANVAKV